MKRRCYNPNGNRYERYGGRGIKVCDRWLTSFMDFLKDMGRRPPGMTIGRIDNDGDYCLENCRWQTAKEQANNRIDNRVIEYEGKRSTLSEWANHLKIPCGRLSHRICRWKDASPREILFGRDA
jgi:hypothetical protein